MAAFVSAVASDVLGVPVSLERSEIFPDEMRFRMDSFETARGKVRWLSLEVCPRGINIHSTFDAPQFAPVGANPHSGKWNHYLWPDVGESLDTYKESLAVTLRYILAKLAPLPGVVRHDRPDMSDYWAFERAKFAAECKARESAA